MLNLQTTKYILRQNKWNRVNGIQITINGSCMHVHTCIMKMCEL